MRHHPIANVWPMMQDEQLKELAADIKKNGLLQPIWLYKGAILDGRNRWAACEIAGVIPRTNEYTGDEPTAFAVSLNDKRRHMTKAVLAAVAVELLPYFEEDAKKRQVQSGGDKVSQEARAVKKKNPEPLPRPSSAPVVEKIPQPLSDPRPVEKTPPAPAPIESRKARDDAAKATGVNERYIQDAKKVKQESPEIFEKLKAGKISIQDAKREVAKIPVDDWRKDERDRQALAKNGVTVVANAQADKNLICWAEREGIAVRIDRGTRYGNPFILGEDGERDYVCDAFEKHYLPNKPSIQSRLIAFGELSGKVLVCHCFPHRCHGNTLAEIVNRRSGK